jgi:hypothetical protein
MEAAPSDAIVTDSVVSSEAADTNADIAAPGKPEQAPAKVLSE